MTHLYSVTFEKSNNPQVLCVQSHGSRLASKNDKCCRGNTFFFNQLSSVVSYSFAKCFDDGAGLQNWDSEGK